MSSNVMGVGGSGFGGVGQDVSQVRVVGMEEVKQNLISLIDRMVRETDIAAQESAEELLLMSKKIVPFDTGELFDTGRIQEGPNKAGAIVYDVLYDAPHAVVVHETQLDYHTGSPTKSGFKQAYPDKKQWHYLSDPVEQMGPRLVKNVGEAVRKAVSGLASAATLKPKLVKPGGARLVKPGGVGSIQTAVQRAIIARPRRSFFTATKKFKAFQARRAKGRIR